MIPTWAFNESIKIGFECKYVLVITCLRGRFGINCARVYFENFEIAQVKRGQFQDFQKS